MPFCETALPDGGMQAGQERPGGQMNELSMENVCVFPGMELIYESVHLSAAVDLGCDGGSVFEIRHCREGRIECQSGGECFFLGPGDLSIGRPGSQVRTVRECTALPEATPALSAGSERQETGIPSPAQARSPHRPAPPAGSPAPCRTFCGLWRE